MASDDPDVHPPMILAAAQAAKLANAEHSGVIATSETAQRPVQLQRRRVWRYVQHVDLTYHPS